MANVVLPKVRMFIPCLGIDFAQGAARTIHTPLHMIRMPPGVSKNYMLDEIWFYVVLTDGVGKFRVTVEMYGESGFMVKRSQSRLIVFEGGSQLKVVELPIEIKMLPFANAGLFEFRWLPTMPTWKRAASLCCGS